MCNPAPSFQLKEAVKSMKGKREWNKKSEIDWELGSE
jgi:hypothetical protein